MGVPGGCLLNGLTKCLSVVSYKGIDSTKSPKGLLSQQQKDILCLMLVNQMPRHST